MKLINNPPFLQPLHWYRSLPSSVQSVITSPKGTFYRMSGPFLHVREFKRFIAALEYNASWIYPILKLKLPADAEFKISDATNLSTLIFININSNHLYTIPMYTTKQL